MLDGNSLYYGIVKDRSRSFECSCDVLVGDVAAFACFVVKSRKKSLRGGSVMLEMEVASTQGANRAVISVTIGFVINTYAFPPILLIV